MVFPALVLLGFGPVHTPKVGSAERRAMMEGLRRVVGPTVRQAVVFKTDFIRSDGEWAFLKGVPRRPDGRPLDYRRTPYQRAIENGAFDDNFSAILRRKGKRWSAVEWAVGSTDVPWDRAWERLKLPRALFP